MFIYRSRLRGRSGCMFPESQLKSRKISIVSMQYLTFPKTSSYSLQFPLNNYKKWRSKRLTCCERAMFQSNCSSTRQRCTFAATTVLVFMLCCTCEICREKTLFAFLNSRVLRETFCRICSRLGRSFYVSYFEDCVL